jgi:hypothetical protein
VDRDRQRSAFAPTINKTTANTARSRSINWSFKIKKPMFNQLLFSCLFVAMCSLAAIVFLGKLLISQKLGVHALGGDELGPLGFLDAVGMSLACVVVRTRILLLLIHHNKKHRAMLDVVPFAHRRSNHESPSRTVEIFRFARSQN